MFKYLKRKHISGEEVSDEESQIPQPNTSKGKVSDVKKKKNRLYRDTYLAWPYMDIVCGIKLANTTMAPKV